MSWSLILWTVTALSRALQDTREQRGQAISPLSELESCLSKTVLCHRSRLGGRWCKNTGRYNGTKNEGPKSTGNQPPYRGLKVAGARPAYVTGLRQADLRTCWYNCACWRPNKSTRLSTKWDLPISWVQFDVVCDDVSRQFLPEGWLDVCTCTSNKYIAS